MKINFDTSKFEFNHGKQPRGKGFWFFEINFYPIHRPVNVHGSYADAKKVVIREAREYAKKYAPDTKSVTVTVLP